jgi:trimeric autotransporter adhesin
VGGGGNNVISSGSYGTVGGGYGNSTIASYATVAGGNDNSAAGNSATVGGGSTNSAFGDYATVAGGNFNGASGSYGAVGGGYGNSAGNATGGSYGTVGGGYANFAYTNYSTVGGGNGNIASGIYSTVSGGSGNIASGQYAIAAGGHSNNASGDFSFAGGNHAQALYQGDFVWADDNGGVLAATAANQFYVRASGGVALYTSSSTGATLAAGSSSWSMVSDRNAKENFQPVDTQRVLNDVAAMPMTTWNYKTQAKSIRHVGPMAQDFHAAFQVGENDTTISTVDEGGVALAAIQGLNQKLEEQRAENADLKARLEKLEELLTTKNGTAK